MRQDSDAARAAAVPRPFPDGLVREALIAHMVLRSCVQRSRVALAYASSCAFASSFSVEQERQLWAFMRAGRLLVLMQEPSSFTREVT